MTIYYKGVVYYHIKLKYTLDIVNVSYYTMNLIYAYNNVVKK